MKLRRTFLFTYFILSAVTLLSISTLFNGCKSKPSAPGRYQLTGDTIKDGKNLVQIHCTKCHALVPVNALTKGVWKVRTLPSMSHYLSISTYGLEYYKEKEDTTGVSLAEWQTIVAYYNKLAPDTLTPAKPPVPLVKDWAGFSLKKPAHVNDISFTIMAAVNPNTSKIYTSDVFLSNLIEWDAQLKKQKTTTLITPSVEANFSKDSAGNNQAMLTCIGRIDQVDFPNGRILKVNLDDLTNQTPVNLATDLPRPVQTISADFDKDGVDELVVCGQGNLKGALYLEKIEPGKKTYKQYLMTERTGATQAIAKDFNNDGYVDIMVLFGIGNEGVSLFLNDRKGWFTSKELLAFPPAYGSSSFQLADIDHDGDLDLIYTAGYNYRNSRILKPYHGLYIYINTGNFNFKQAWFYPINGCTKAIAADFDHDGDIDIATIAFFADMKNNPAEEFIYFEQKKPMQFIPHAVPVSQHGRWMTMDVADLNKDGKPDIVLGNYASGFLFQPNFTPSWDEHLPFIVLQNNMK